MANAKRKKNRATQDDVFEMPLVDALNQLLPARHITPGARWFFEADGDRFIINRCVTTDTATDPES